MQQDIERILIDRHTIANRVREIAEQITADFQEEGTPGLPEITIVPILTGSFMFVADLVRDLPLRMQIRLITVSSYPGTSTESKPAKIGSDLDDLPASLAGSHVLLVDDILDSGQTLRLVSELLSAKNPASLKSCVLLRKKRPAAMQQPVDYVAFDIPDEFVVGYGLDYDDYYRNLPDIVVLKPDVVSQQQEG
ncbi:MAG TPA: hypoxanthine phosphoribosyltransferase [Phycisphaerales bacterium]|nr:hypoxanthine phosphoribosyltransferase [Phycisphaerales bacterium]HCD32189.1 hypoxanthine phosphoribosyltransferase [Phycisphaerales bacterium]